MRARSDECERLAESLGPGNADLRENLRGIAAQWRRLADDAEAHPNPPFRLVKVCTGRLGGRYGFLK